MLRITKIFRFETAHRISNYNGSCSNIHGHSYELHVTVQGEPDTETGMIIDFKQLKSIVHEEVIQRFDHALILKEGTTDTSSLQHLNIVLMETEPTAELLLLFIVQHIQPRLPSHVRLHQLKLYETNTSYAEWVAE